MAKDISVFNLTLRLLFKSVLKTCLLGETEEMRPRTRDYTIRLHKLLHKVQFKKRAPRAIREIKSFARKVMQTKDVRIDTMLNKIIWSEGIRNVPRRIRVRIARQANVDELSTEKMFTLVQYVSVDSFKGLKTNVVDLE
ncbi:ribosomal protein RPL31 [Cardiosporidium cionae]|uniref:Ribosomal protein RPL31 n=1 Tax=Cardiosporidium cionae TaxID=476202 RepID=A0ABQ7JFR2_9APIC|nr:ribosomal protein RPL31 [Cardiosporidium cionae]|eukprot:KAF8822490.1 ribosomal protein RPL31 [Cardiosporidium cionae]